MIFKLNAPIIFGSFKTSPIFSEFKKSLSVFAL